MTEQHTPSVTQADRICARGIRQSLSAATGDMLAARHREQAQSESAALIRELVEALEPFAAVAEHDIGDDETDDDLFRVMGKYNRAPKLTVADLRRARATLAKAREVQS